MLILEYGLVSILILAGVVGLASMLEGEYERLGRANPLKWAGDAFKWISQRPWFLQLVLWPIAITLFIAMCMVLAVINILYIMYIVLAVIGVPIVCVLLDLIMRLCSKSYRTEMRRYSV
ncbi:MAG: hypothetical protein A2751_05410 [Candidatus Doudnabacteria bacterium RIFCSPHIGHO2_01_FULL_46_14]|uniref:Uncharacterized protein n=1 Tax=Candidatus Doudnabacteria bacterium RIFCSPHIGHO2_01_FULL_46_14 TaxID=1817824 RepID=A0A1F5NPZ5_9BACT|nr:MAG: hypothetical protein A2751_05410 [Candidatus Doudnabacteria bacterium RIFCSPHIGHO2_01_FULL_46_14]